LTYTVAQDWVNQQDFPAFFSLVPPDQPDSTTIFIATDVVAVGGADACSQEPEPGVGRSANDLASWIDTLDGVMSSGRQPTVVGGLSGWTMTVRVAPEWTATCPWSDGEPARAVFTDSTPGDGFHWGIPPGGAMRLWLLDLGDGRTLLIDYEAATQAAFEDFQEEAVAVVESFAISR
jgi:hypothetical protein